MVFRFLKKKKVGIPSLPKMEELPEFSFDLPSFPSLKEEKQLPPLKAPSPQIEVPSIKFPELPPLDEKEEMLLPPLKPENIKRAVEEPKPTPGFKVIEAPGYTFREIGKKQERPREFTKRIPEIRAQEPGKIIVKEKKVYVRMENYRIVLGSLNSIKVNLTESADSLQRLENLSNNQGANFEKWESVLNAIQKKIITVDRIILKS